LLNRIHKIRVLEAKKPPTGEKTIGGFKWEFFY
jgi:hypothetical protein